MNELELEGMLTNLLTGKINLSHAITRLKNTIFRSTELEYAKRFSEKVKQLSKFYKLQHISLSINVLCLFHGSMLKKFLY
jgi:hypothetical protein